jgi:hypothetical protein
MDNDAKTATLKLLSYCQAENWAGYEPYDALNSRVLATSPLFNSKLFRLAVTQALKRSPVNIRRFLQIPKTQNPKAIALFLSAFIKLSRVGVANQDGYVELMIDRLIALRSQGVPYWCWGYNFPWQTRSVLVPRWAPNLVCTAFAASALLDVYEQRNDDRCLGMAVSAAEYIFNELHWIGGSAIEGFGYPMPSVRNQIHNANLLAAGLFCRVYKHTNEEKFISPALRVARYSAAKQHADGGWDYGDAPAYRWIDNFHTGFNLCALRAIGNYAETAEFEQHLRRGLAFYLGHFFCENGAVRYFHDRTYPLDSHCIAQSIITLLELKDLDPRNISMAFEVFQWAMKHMWDKRGFYYYRILRTCTIRTSYMRWTQAWMFLSLSMLLSESETLVEKDISNLSPKITAS